MNLITPQDLENQDKYKRVQLLNAISGPRQVSMIGTISPSGTTNLGLFNSITHIGANPPYLGFIMRPITVQRHTYENIKANGHYTINHVNGTILDQAHKTSAKYPFENSEFRECQFTEEYIDNFNAPFVKESLVKIGLTYQEEYPIQCNGTIMVIGSVEYIILPEGSEPLSSVLDYQKTNNIVVAGLEDYYSLTYEGSKGYVRP